MIWGAYAVMAGAVLGGARHPGIGILLFAIGSYLYCASGRDC